MGSIIFAGIALLIMILIMYFLPLGFSTKGRAVIISAALVISLMGQLTTSLISTGQAMLFILLLIGCVGYFLTKNVDMFLLPTIDDELEIVPDSVRLADSNPSTDSFSYIALSDTGMKEMDDDEADQILNNDLKEVGTSALNLLLGNRDKMESELTNLQYSEVSSLSGNVGDLDESNLNDQVDTISLDIIEEPKFIEAENETYDLPEDNLEEDEIAELPEKQTVSVVEDQIIEESDPENIIDEIDELPEIDFEAQVQDQTSSKKSENGLDEDFWTSLLEEEELDVIEEKKDKSYAKYKP